jgi:hypothetical protein
LVFLLSGPLAVIRTFEHTFIIYILFLFPDVPPSLPRSRPRPALTAERLPVFAVAVRPKTSTLANEKAVKRPI